MAGAIIAYSSRADEFVLFGGWNGTTFNRTWAFDPETLTWSEIKTQHHPPARGDGNFAYDELADAFVLFGGWYESPVGTYHRLGDTWIFYLGNRTWIPRFPSVSPSPRSDSAVAYEPVGGRTLLFGGFDGNSYVGDMWAYNLAQNSWAPIPVQAGPSPRADGRMTYDRRDSELYLFGGNDYSGPNFTFHHLGDTWKFDPTINGWSNVSTSISPSPRDYSVLAYNPDTDHLILQSGYGNGTILTDTWIFNIARHTWGAGSRTGPPARFAAVGGYATRSHVLMIFGGLGNQSLLADTWLFSEEISSGSPPGGILGPLAIGLAFLLVALVAVLVIRIRQTRLNRRANGARTLVGRDRNPDNRRPKETEP